MKTIGKIMLAGAIGVGALLTVAASDPVLMTINGKDVHLSEFNYLYNKNSQQQVEKESLDRYVDRFVTYKLKVADAEAAGVDTTKAFRDELEGYRKDIVGPFLADSSAIDREAHRLYAHHLRNVDVDHMMLMPGKTVDEQHRQLALMDSLRGRILAGESWDSIAVHYSADPSVRRNMGHYGYVMAGVFPAAWENVAFETPVGQISQPFATKYGVHMLRVNAERPDEGSVLTAHILKIFDRNKLNDSIKAAMLAEMELVCDSIQAGADFTEMAARHSDDFQTKSRGGMLPWVSRGRMVPEFENVAFSLANGEVSRPVESVFGYHIIKRIDSRPTPSFDELRDRIVKTITNDEELSKAPRQAVIDRMKAQYGFKMDKGLDKWIDKALSKAGGYDKAFVENVMRKSNQTACSFAGRKLSVGDLSSKLDTLPITNRTYAIDYIKTQLAAEADNAVMEHYSNHIIDDNADFRNLMGEYRDGMLLFEISDRRIWKGASADTIGLERYYAEHRNNYLWTEPRFKGVILSARNDSVLQAVKADLAKIDRSLPVDTIAQKLFHAHGGAIKMDRMTVKKGDNKLADYVIFGTGTEMPYKNYATAMVLDGGLIDQPTGLDDVRGRVTSDYQDVLEKRWIEELKAKYPVKINKKVLGTLR